MFGYVEGNKKMTNNISNKYKKIAWDTGFWKVQMFLKDRIINTFLLKKHCIPRKIIVKKTFLTGWKEIEKKRVGDRGNLGQEFEMHCNLRKKGSLSFISWIPDAPQSWIFYCEPRSFFILFFVHKHIVETIVHSPLVTTGPFCTVTF